MTENDAYFRETVREITENGRYAEMKKYRTHSTVTLYEHSLAVAVRAYSFAVKRDIKCDLRSLIRGALLHDYFLYDWHKNPKFTFHGFRHAKIALKNALKDYKLNEKEKNIIASHMFPLNLFSFPKSKEAWIVTFADKKQAIIDTFKKR